MTTTTTTPVTDFWHGMGPHGDDQAEADIVAARRAHGARHPQDAHLFCVTCTSYIGAGSAPCRTCGAAR